MGRVLVTGAAGFVGHAVCSALLARGDTVRGWDSLDPYYSVALKRRRLEQLSQNRRFHFEEVDINKHSLVSRRVAEFSPSIIIHLAAKVGVRGSSLEPASYLKTNVLALQHLLEESVRSQVRHFLYASSSSVYGANNQTPNSIRAFTDHPLSVYAASKKSGELLAHCYSHIHSLPTTGMRFFSVYGPWGRPDMIAYRFTEAILRGEPIELFGFGAHQRDFTYIEDVVRAILLLADRPPQQHPDQCFRICNVGSEVPVSLEAFVSVLERLLGRQAIKKYSPRLAEDAERTESDSGTLRAMGWKPETGLEQGLKHFIEWYTRYSTLDTQTGTQPDFQPAANPI